ncbi:hypothetical protein BBJ29_004660 [Phytophthora kernoviae]|uniref:purine-nucleoside phosphorylase n=1 Tax=Phytophthora kernoviae TaxID=325452 RepID=A0A3F2RSK9_9STRA|nr:hypothetical protein BBP00_00004104 [Phytophthora kernoviae]RLN71206.1 hypothetical protein BBJ29_004660 [Phytophthora kernoviae]
MADETVPRERIDIINEFLQERVSIRPLIGVVCGSGLGGLSNCLSNQEVIKYEDIPQFPRSTVEGHAGELVFGDLDGVRVVCMRGRFHCYEGYAMRETALPIRVMYLLGIKYLLVTNAAGGLNENFNVGDLMVLNDHLNMPGLSGQHPLIGPNDSRFGSRFVPLTNCYDKKLQDLAFSVAEKQGLAHKMRRGVYGFVTGPTYETPTECRFLRLIGCDAVGMSTVPEHPLIGLNGSRFGSCFVPLINYYDKKLQGLAHSVAEKMNFTHKVRRGVYGFVTGPTYETPTECRFLRLIGCDAVGMSTVPEAIVAAHCELKNIGLSVITNKALFPGEEGSGACHEEVLETVQATQNDIESFVSNLISAVGKQHHA